jgi:hypothetical protein
MSASLYGLMAATATVAGGGLSGLWVFLWVRCLSCGLSGDFVSDLSLFKGDLWVLEDENGSGFMVNGDGFV